jgi:hypothetical protein
MLQNEADAYRKIRLRAEDVQGRNVLTNFWVSYCSHIDCLPSPSLPEHRHWQQWRRQQQQGGSTAPVHMLRNSAGGSRALLLEAHNGAAQMLLCQKQRQPQCQGCSSGLQEP